MKKTALANEPGIPSILFKPLKTRRAFEEISAEIKRMMFSGMLKPGDKLPSEVALAAQFGVSRQTLREALRSLESTGFILMQKGASGGPLVVDTTLNSIGDLFLDAFRLKTIRTEELTKARLDIEKIVLKNVFEVGNKQAIADIREAVTIAQRKMELGSRAFEDNIAFHKRLAQATGNTVLVIVVEALMAVVAHFHSVLRVGVLTIRGACKTHERIIEAIEDGDECGAEAALEKDILQIDGVYNKLMKRPHLFSLKD